MISDTLPKILYRNTERQFAESFVQRGELLFRPLSHFHKIEGHRQDEHEGHVLSDLIGAKLEIHDDAENSWHEIEFTKGFFVRKLAQVDYLMIKCFSVVSQPNYGDSTIEIHDAEGFINRIKHVLQNQLGVVFSCGLVRYYDPLSPPDQNVVADQMWLYKRDCYKADVEFRIGFLANTGKLQAQYVNGRSLRMCIGSLGSFARIL